MTQQSPATPPSAAEPDLGDPTAAAKAAMKAVLIIDTVSIWSGKAVAWLIFPMTLSLVWEVVARYFFNAPTVWANDIATMLYGAFFMLGSAYALQRQQHIRTDLDRKSVV